MCNGSFLGLVSGVGLTIVTDAIWNHSSMGFPVARVLPSTIALNSPTSPSKLGIVLSIVLHNIEMVVTPSWAASKPRCDLCVANLRVNEVIESLGWHADSLWRRVGRVGVFLRVFVIVAIRVIFLAVALVVLIRSEDDIIVVARRWRTRWWWTDALLVFIDLLGIGWTSRHVNMRDVRMRHFGDGDPLPFVWAAYILGVELERCPMD